jgi:hypothetical protein
LEIIIIQQIPWPCGSVVDLQPRGCEFDSSPFDNYLSIKNFKKGEIEHRSLCSVNTG